MTWDQLKTDFLSRIQGLYERTFGRLQSAIAATPEAFRQRVTAYLDLLAQIRANLERILARLPNPPQSQADAVLIAKYAELKAMYDALVAGIASNAVAVKTEIGVAPAVVLVIGIIGLTVSGVAWAVASYEYAVSLRDQTDFMVKELDARVEAMRSGAQLPATTALPPSAPAAVPARPRPAGWAPAGPGCSGASPRRGRCCLRRSQARKGVSHVRRP
jgi:hypothetical protein